ncbi:MAG: glycosyltransferase [Acidimicrobiales bacterium]
MNTPAHTVLSADRRWWRSRDRRGVLAGSPGTFLRVSENGVAVLDSVEAAHPVERSVLTSRLVATGAAHPEPGAPVAATDVTVVVPVFAADTGTVQRVQQLVDLLAPLAVVVVDDCSPVAVDVRCSAVVRRDTNGGPGAARNSGLATVGTPVVAFVDSDVQATAADILRLTGHLADPQVALVAPRVMSRDGLRAVEQYDALRSPLDMGPHPATVRPRSHVPYVPTAVLVTRADTVRADTVRADTVRAGFDEGLRWGEDVEFVWRTVAAGAVCIYDPAVTCTHEPRRGIAAMISQRFGYGRSAAGIDSRIPWSVAPVQANVFHVAPLALLLAGQLPWAAAALAVSVAWTFVALHGMGLAPRDRLEVARLSVSSASGALARAVCREWWPAFAVASAFSQAFTVALFMPLSALLLIDLRRSRPSNQALFVVMRLLDWAAYGAGVWAGALERRSPRCLLPRLSVRRSARAA